MNVARLQEDSRTVRSGHGLRVVGIHVLGLLVVWVPILSSSHDVWDGATSSFAAHSGRMEGVAVWFEEAGQPAFYLLQMLLIAVTRVTPVSFLVVSSLVAAVAHQVLIREARLLLRSASWLSTRGGLWGSLMVAVAPSGWLFHSTVLHLYLIGLAVGVVGARYVAEQKSAFLFAPLLIFAFTFSSMLVLAPVLVLAHHQLREERIFVLPRTVLRVFGLAAVTYALMRVLLRPYGLYSDYNSLVVPRDQAALATLVRMSLEAMSSFIPPLGAVALVVLLIGIRSAPWGRMRREPFVIATTLAFSAIIPYLAVGKVSSIFETQQWSARHAMLLMFALPVACILAVEGLTEHAPSSKHWVSSLALSGVVLTNAMILGSGIETIKNRQSFDRALADLIQEQADEVPPGRVRITGDGIPGPLTDSPEIHRMFFDATGRLDWYVEIDRKNRGLSEQDLEPIIWSDPRYGVKYLYEAVEQRACTTIWTVTVSSSEVRRFPRPMRDELTVELVSADFVCDSALGHRGAQ